MQASPRNPVQRGADCRVACNVLGLCSAAFSSWITSNRSVNLPETTRNEARSMPSSSGAMYAEVAMQTTISADAASNIGQASSNRAANANGIITSPRFRIGTSAR
eukprot:4373068-Prymnesium_polylepis.1